MSAATLNKLIQQLYINKFDADEIGAMLQNWDQQKWLKRRMPILKEAITDVYKRQTRGWVATPWRLLPLRDQGYS